MISSKLSKFSLPFPFGVKFSTPMTNTDVTLLPLGYINVSNASCTSVEDAGVGGGGGGAAEDSSFYVACSRLSVSSDHDRKSRRPTSGTYLLPQTSFVVRPLFRSSVLTHSLKQAIFSPLSDIFC